MSDQDAPKKVTKVTVDIEIEDGSNNVVVFQDVRDFHMVCGPDIQDVILPNFKPALMVSEDIGVVIMFRNGKPGIKHIEKE